MHHEIYTLILYISVTMTI